MRVRDSSNHSQLLPLALSALLLASIKTLANEYSFEYEVEAGYEYYDNINLEPEDEIDTAGGLITIPATLATRSERLEAFLIGELAWSRYSEDAYDSDDQYLEARSKYSFENSGVEGYASYDRDTTLDTEFLDTGMVGREATRVETAEVGGTGYYRFTERDDLFVDLSYSDVDYQSELYDDYNFTSGNLGWINQRSKRLSLRVQAYGNHFEGGEAEIEVETDSLGAEFGFEYDVSEQLQTSLLVGWVWAETDYSASLAVPPDSSESNDLLLQGSLMYSQERYELEASIASRPDPSGNGYVINTQQANLDYRYRLTERTRLDMGFIVGRSEAEDSRINNDRDYARARLGFNYIFSESWQVSAHYEYTYQDEEQETGDAKSNAVYLGIIFKPKKSVWSR
jgi:hypothetical protein